MSPRPVGWGDTALLRENPVHWILLAVAIALEVFATSMLKASAGFTRLWPSLAVVGGYALSFYLLSQVLRVLPVGTAYAIWSGAGTLLVVAIGVAVYREHLTPVQVAGIVLTVAGVVMLNLGGSTHEAPAATPTVPLEDPTPSS